MATPDKKTPPAMKNAAMKPMMSKKSKPSPGTGDKICPKCKKGGMTACSHM